MGGRSLRWKASKQITQWNEINAAVSAAAVDLSSMTTTIYDRMKVSKVIMDEPVQRLSIIDK